MVTTYLYNESVNARACVGVYECVLTDVAFIYFVSYRMGAYKICYRDFKI